MKELEGVDAADPRFAAVLGTGVSLADHVTDEEREQFPQLRARVPREELVEIASKVEAAKKLAPTRPHPGAPNSELFHKLVGPGSAWSTACGTGCRGGRRAALCTRGRSAFRSGPWPCPPCGGGSISDHPQQEGHSMAAPRRGRFGFLGPIPQYSTTTRRGTRVSVGGRCPPCRSAA